MVDLSIIIVSYNAKHFLRQCLVSITENVSKKLQYEIIVVDNASTDASASVMSNAKSQMSKQSKDSRGGLNVKWIQNGENLGFSKANNIGVRYAKGRYILFLNADTVVGSGVIEGMVAFMETHADAGAATCKLVLEDGQIDYAIHRGFPTPWNAFCYFLGLGRVFKHSKLFSGYTLGWLGLNTTHEVDAIAGAFMLVRRQAGEEVNWWDEDYFFNGEDLDFCYELKQKAWKIYYVHQYTMLHYGGVSGGTKKHSQNITTASRESIKRVQKARFEAMRIFYKKHYTGKYSGFVNSLVTRGINLKERLT